MNIENSKECEDAINSPINFRTIKLTRFKQIGISLGIIALKSIKTKFGRSYILLDNQGRRTLGNNKINNFIVKKIVGCDAYKNKGLDYKGLDDFHYNNGSNMFYITIGNFAEYNGHQYNEINIESNNWSLSEDEFNKEQDAYLTQNVLDLEDESEIMKFLCSKN